MWNKDNCTRCKYFPLHFTYSFGKICRLNYVFCLIYDNEGNLPSFISQCGTKCNCTRCKCFPLHLHILFGKEICRLNYVFCVDYDNECDLPSVKLQFYLPMWNKAYNLTNTVFIFF